MRVDATSRTQLADRVRAAIRNAADATGVDFDFLLRQAQVESGLDPAARAPNGSASGLYQFIDQTWLAALKRHGAEHGLGWAANLVERVGGRLRVKDLAARAAVLALRQDPGASAMMAAEHAADNAEALATRLGRTVNQTDLYLAHFLGIGGATRFLKAFAIDANLAAAEILPAAARSNRSVFFGKDGAPRSLRAVYDRFAARFGESGGVAALLAPASPSTSKSFTAPAATAAVRGAQAAYLLLAEFGG